MPLARIADTILFFVHIPKTGGSSIEAYMRAKGTVALCGARRGWSRVSPQHLHRDLYAELVPASFYDRAFAVLRDPKARLMSEFRMQVEAVRPRPRPVSWLLGAGRRAAGRRLHPIRAGGGVEYLDFDAWAGKILRAYRRNPYLKDNHIRPQAEYVEPGQTLFAFEHGLDPVFRWIDAVTQTPAADGTFHEKRGSRIELSCSAETEDLIRDFYRDDYALIASLEPVP